MEKKVNWRIAIVVSIVKNDEKNSLDLDDGKLLNVIGD